MDTKTFSPARLFALAFLFFFLIGAVLIALTPEPTLVDLQRLELIRYKP